MTQVKTFKAFYLGAALLISQTSFAHPEDPRVGLELDETGPVKAGKISISFQMIDLKKKTLVSEQDLDVSHEKKLHFFVYEPALVEFRHLHPEYLNSTWQTEVDLSVNGNYWLWAQGVLAIDKAEFASSVQLDVIDGKPANPTPPKLGDVRTGVDGISRITLSKEKLKAKKMAMLTLTFSRTNGTQPVLTPYLGELAHAVTVLEDGDTLIHTHPMSTGSPTSLMLHMTFHEVGDYRIWVQFIDDKILKTVPLSVSVGP